MSLYIGETKITGVKMGSQNTIGLVDTSDATLYKNSQLPNGISAYARRQKYTGSAQVDPTITISDDTITIPAGYYTETIVYKKVNGSWVEQ